MILKFYTDETELKLGYDSTEKIVSTLHRKWIGENNEYHDTTSLYSLSRVQGNKEILSDGILFKSNIHFMLKSPDTNFIQQVALGVNNHPEALDCEWKTELIDFPVEYITERRYKFVMNSPIVARDINVSRGRDLKYNDSEYQYALNRVATVKLDQLGIDGRFQIKPIINGYTKSKIESQKGGKYYIRTNSHDVIVESKHPEVIHALALVGIGAKTGIGFGSVKQLEIL